MTRTREFSHIVAGLSWPYLDQPGAIVVLKTVWDPRDRNGFAWFREIAHEEHEHLPNLFRAAARLQDRHTVDEWWGDALNEAVAAILYGQELGCDPVALAPAPYIEHKDRSVLYLQTLREMVAPPRPVLIFNEGSRLPDKIRQYPLAEAKPIERFPSLAALCYAASSLHLWLQLTYVKPEKAWGALIEERIAKRYDEEEDALPWGEEETDREMEGVWM